MLKPAAQATFRDASRTRSTARDVRLPTDKRGPVSTQAPPQEPLATSLVPGAAGPAVSPRYARTGGAAFDLNRACTTIYCLFAALSIGSTSQAIDATADIRQREDVNDEQVRRLAAQFPSRLSQLVEYFTKPKDGRAPVSQNVLAARCGMESGSFSKLMSDHARGPTVATLIKLVSGLHANPYFLLFGTDPMLDEQLAELVRERVPPQRRKRGSGEFPAASDTPSPPPSAERPSRPAR